MRRKNTQMDSSEVYVMSTYGAMLVPRGNGMHKQQECTHKQNARIETKRPAGETVSMLYSPDDQRGTLNSNPIPAIPDGISRMAQNMAMFQTSCFCLFMHHRPSRCYTHPAPEYPAYVHVPRWKIPCLYLWRICLLWTARERSWRYHDCGSPYRDASDA